MAAKIAVMASGRGSNLKAILDAAARSECPVKVEVVISDKAGAPALAIARDAGVPMVESINPKDFADRAAFDAACADVIARAGCEWIALAGYMRILSSAFVQRFSGKIINIHPALLPAFPGAHSVEDALNHGVKVAGCTVHVVDDVLDGGPILAQSAVPVLDDDTVESLHNRIHEQEHRLYPATLKRLVETGYQLHGRRVVWNRGN